MIIQLLKSALNKPKNIFIIFFMMMTVVTNNFLEIAAYRNWIKAFSFYNEDFFKQNGVSGSLYPKIPIAFFNNIIESNLNESDVKSTIEWVSNKYQQHNVPFCWTITPFAKPDNLEDHLKDNGFSEFGATPHMGVLNSDINKEKLSEEIKESNLVMKKVTVKNVDTYTSTFLEGYEMKENDDLVQEFIAINRKIFASDNLDSDFKTYLGYFDNKPVCTSTMMVSDEVTGIYSISTTPEFRKRGFGRIITADLILKGFEQTKGSILQSSSMGKSVYEKLGFKTLYKAKTYKLDQN